MTLTLNLPDEDERRLARKAKAAGVDVKAYVECIVRAAASRPPIDEILRPVPRGTGPWNDASSNPSAASTVKAMIR